MTTFIEIPQIEDLFTKQQRLQNPTIAETTELSQLKNILFKTDLGLYSNYFWKQLNLLQVVSLAMADILAFYNAYYYNYANFKKLCNKAWFQKKLDLSSITRLRVRDLQFLCKIFDEIKIIILPPKISYSVLIFVSTKNYLKRIFFNINFQTTVFRPQLQQYNLQELSIKAKIFTINSTIIDILLTFPTMKRIKLEEINFNLQTIAALSTIQVKELKLKNCAINWGIGNEFIKAILNLKLLTSLSITYEFNRLWIKDEIHHILQNINKLPYIEKLVITTKTSRKIIKSINSLKNLKYLHIIETGSSIKKREKHVKKLYKNDSIVHITPINNYIYFL